MVESKVQVEQEKMQPSVEDIKGWPDLLISIEWDFNII